MVEEVLQSRVQACAKHFLFDGGLHLGHSEAMYAEFGHKVSFFESTQKSALMMHASTFQPIKKMQQHSAKSEVRRDCCNEITVNGQPTQQPPPFVISFDPQEHSRDRWGNMDLGSPVSQSFATSNVQLGTKSEVRQESSLAGKRLRCPDHASIALAERRPFDCGTFVFHPVCPLCVREELYKDSSGAKQCLEILAGHYSFILKDSREKSPQLRRLISEVEDLKGDVEDGVKNIETSDLEKRFSKALPEIERLVKGTRKEATKPTILEQLRLLGNDLSTFNAQLVKLSERTSDCYKAALVDVTTDVIQQLVSLDLLQRQDEILTCANAANVFAEFEKLQTCMAEVTKTLSGVSLRKSRRSDKAAKKGRTIKSSEVHLHKPSPYLDSIAEGSVEGSSSRSDDPLPDQILQYEPARPTFQNPWEDLQEEWEQSTVVSSSCSSTEVGMSVRTIVHRLKNCTGNDLSILVFLECIDDWCLKDDLRSIEFSASGGISAIVHCMQVTTGSPNIQAKACETLKYLAINTSNQPLIAVVGGILSTLTAMSAYPNNVKIQTAALGALKHLCTYEGTGDEIILNDGLDIIIAAMHTHPGHSAIQRHACAILNTLDWTEAGPSAVSVLFSCIRNNMGEGELQSQAVRVLERVLDKTTEEENTSPRSAIRGILCVLESFIATKSHELIDSPIYLDLSKFESDSKQPKTDMVLLNPFNLKGTSEPNGDERLVSKAWQSLLSDSSVVSVVSNESIDEVFVPDFNDFDDEDDDYERIALINEVLAHLQKHLEYPAVQLFGFNALSALVDDEMSACAFLHTDGLNVVLEAMSEHPNETNIQEIGCALIADLACIDEFAELPQLTEIRRTLLRVLDEHKNKHKMCRWACSALELLSKVDTNQDLGATDPGVESIVSVMKEHKDQVDVIEPCIGALWELSFNCYIGDFITQASGIDLIMASLLLHPSSQAIERDGYDVLSFTISDDPHGDASEQQTQEVLGILQEYIGETTSGKAKEQDAVIASTEYHRWLATLSRTLRCTKSGPILHSCGTKILQIIAVRKDIHSVLTTSGVLDAVVVAMKSHLTNEMLQAYCCEFFCDLACSKRCRKAMVKADAVRSIMTTMSSHLDSVRVYQAACAALRNMAHDSEIRSDLIIAGVPSLAFDAMARYSTVASIQEDCCGLLWSLALDDVGLDSVISGGGIAPILSCMAQFRDRTHLQSDALGALLAIITYENSFEDELLAEMTDVVGSTLATQRQNEVVQQYGQELLEVATNLLAASSASFSSSDRASSDSSITESA